MGLWSTFVWIVATVCAVWVIYDVWTSKSADTTKKVLWTIAAVLFSIITAIVYYFLEKK